MVFKKPEVLYGCVEKIIECQLPNNPTLGVFSGKLCMQAYITLCKTDNKDATQVLTPKQHPSSLI